MILIAHAATNGGARSPAVRVADQVFNQLAMELAAQGVAKHVIADMFGMALRTYHRKMRAISDSPSSSGTSAWEAILTYIRKNEPVSRGELGAQFRQHDAQILAGVLMDLTQSGWTYRTGRGDGQLYRVADDADFEATGISPSEGDGYMIWLAIYRHGPITAEQIAESTGITADRCEQAIPALVRDGRVDRRFPSESPVTYESLHFDVEQHEVPGTPKWQAAVIDHFQAMVVALCIKLRDGQEAVATGGATFTFDVGDDHPLEQEARDTLETVRAMLIDLRQRVDDHNKVRGVDPTTLNPVVFYVGQYVKSSDTPASTAV